MKNTLFLILGLSFMAFSCKKEEPDNETPVNIPADTSSTSSSAVFIINEGNFQWGNSTVTLFNIASKQVTDNIFQQVNNRPLGDVGQSMEIHNGKGYIVVDNSGKIEVVDPATFQSVGAISGLGSPRYFLGISAVKAYVTDIWANKVSVVDLNTNTVTATIPIKGWTEELVLSNSKVFITNVKSKYVYVVDATNDQLQDSIKLSYASNSIKKDKNGKLWVLCGGDSDSSYVAEIHRIDPTTLQKEYSISFPSQADSPSKLSINGTGDTLYYLNKGVCRLPISQSSLPTSSFISESGKFYGLGIDPKSGIIYVSDAVDYVQKGTIFRHKSSDGSLIDSFKAGISPGSFCFKL